jgi:RNA polymerase sigma-70 factor (ECF subfamily)
VSVAEPAAPGLETAAAERLYERNSSRVFGYCLKLLGNREEAEDASQTTFMQAHRALQRGVVPVYETAWLLTIAKNVCLARHRAAGRRKAVELVRDPQDLESLAGGPDDPDDGRLVGLQDALARLPEMQRRAFLLREWQGYSYANIARDLDVTVPAVEALIFRARRTLAQELGGEERKRRHAFDIASLVATLKTLLGGGTAVKVAIGAATAVTVGAVATGSVERQEGPSRAPTPAPAAVQPETAGGEPAASVAAPGTSGSSGKATAPATSRPGRGTAPNASAPGSQQPGQGTTSRPSAPGTAPAPGAGHQAPTPGDPPKQTSEPTAPQTPNAPPPTASVEVTLPNVELPEVPGVPLPELPEKVKVEVPPLPTDQLPVDVPEVPPIEVELPDLPDLPILP